MSAKSLSWWELWENTSKGLKYPDRDYWLDDFCSSEKEVLSRHSTKEKALNALRKWAESKGIDFDSHMFEQDTNISVDMNNKDIWHDYKLTVVGLFYNLKDEEIEAHSIFDGDYWTMASIHEAGVILDKDEES